MGDWFDLPEGYYVWNLKEESIPIKSPQSWEDADLQYLKSQQKTNGPLDEKELGMRQTHAESGFRLNAHNNRSGAAGIQQIIPRFAPKGYTEADLYDPAKATQARNKMMKSLDSYNTVTQGMPSDSILFARKLAAYNYGPGNLNKVLTKAAAQGKDIDDSWEWVDMLPKETSDYVNFILRGQDTGSSRNNKAYKDSLIKNQKVANIVRNNII